MTLHTLGKASSGKTSTAAMFAAEGTSNSTRVRKSLGVVADPQDGCCNTMGAASLEAAASPLTAYCARTFRACLGNPMGGRPRQSGRPSCLRPRASNLGALVRRAVPSFSGRHRGLEDRQATTAVPFASESTQQGAIQWRSS